MVAANTFYLALFTLMSIFGLLMPLVFILRHRYYLRRFDMTGYQKRFRVGWPITGVGGELTIISVLLCVAWLQQWPSLRQDQWLTLLVVIGSLGVVCFLVGLALTAEGFQYLRMRSRSISIYLEQ